VKLTAKVSPVPETAAIPRGSVRFKVGEEKTLYCASSGQLKNGVATCSVTSAALGNPGSYKITADYLGSDDYATSSGSWTQVIAKPAPQITIYASSVGPIGSVAAVVSNDYGLSMMTGGGNLTVSVRDGNGALVKTFSPVMPGIPVTSGMLTNLSAAKGPYKVTAKFSGDSMVSAGEVSQTLPVSSFARF
jgi:hypothetical protein